MTDDDKALVEELRINDTEIYLPLLGKAADRIEALSAENERLQRSAQYWEQDAKRYAANQEYWRMEERAAIVAYIRREQLDDYNERTAKETEAWWYANAIEAGEHLK